MKNEKMILGTNKEGLKQIQCNNGYLTMGFIGAIGLICMFAGAFLAGLVFLMGSGAGIYSIRMFCKQ